MKQPERTPLGSLLCAAVALAVFLADDHAAAALAWDRSALAEGQWWRLITGHWVHFGPAHVLPNLVVFLWAGWQLERAGRAWFLCSVAILPLFIGVGLLSLDPHLAIYGGLSGINHGFLVLLGFAWWRGGSRLFPAVLWALLALKMGLDFAGVALTPTVFSSPGIRPVPWAHLLGGFGALVLTGIRALVGAVLDRNRAAG